MMNFCMDVPPPCCRHSGDPFGMWRRCCPNQVKNPAAGMFSPLLSALTQHEKAQLLSDLLGEMGEQVARSPAAPQPRIPVLCPSSCVLCVVCSVCCVLCDGFAVCCVLCDVFAVCFTVFSGCWEAAVLLSLFLGPRDLILCRHSLKLCRCLCLGAMSCRFCGRRSASTLFPRQCCPTTTR